MRFLKVLDHHGRPIPVVRAQSFEGAGSGRRLGTWGRSSAGPNTALYGSLSSLRSRSRELTRNNPLAENGVESWVANLIGTGITPRWQIDPALGRSELKERTHELWAEWADESDADGVCDFYGLQAMVARAMVESGEVLVRIRARRLEDDLPVPMQLQVIECDHLDESYSTVSPNGNEIRMGIEFDRMGRRVAYWVFRSHPGESFLLDQGSSERIRIPASEMLHIFRPLRPGQARGKPWLTSVILRLHELDQYEDAELVRKKTAAMFGGFIIESVSDTMDQPFLGRIGETDENENPVVHLEPGTFPTLPQGMDVKFSTPADVGGSYQVWIKQNLREIAAGLGITYEQLTGDLEGVNYSSIRAGLLEFRRRCEMLQWHTIIFQFCRPVARRWMDLAVASGALAIPAYARDRRRYMKIDWRPQGWPWVDPEKDLKAAQLAVRSGFTSRSAVIAEQGYDAETVDRQIKEDADRADALGLVFDSDPRNTARSGAGRSGDHNSTEKADSNDG